MVCNDNSLISVIVPVFNVEKNISSMLGSLINQTYHNFELIIVDDGSTDNSISVAKGILQNSVLQWRIITKKNGGAASARNLGIEHSHGEWIICPDSDDYLAPTTLEFMLKTAIENSVFCVFTGYQSVCEEEIGGISFYENCVSFFNRKEAIKLFLERKLKLLSPGMLLHKSIASLLRYNETCPYDEDVYYVWEVLFSVAEIAFIDSNFYLYVSREGSTVHSLRASSYLAASSAYLVLEKKLSEHNSLLEEKKIIKKIRPKYQLGGLHVLAKSNDYSLFLDTVRKDKSRQSVCCLLFYPNLKLCLYAQLLFISPILFYQISRGNAK